MIFETLEKIKSEACLYSPRKCKEENGENGLKKKHQLQSKLCTYVCMYKR